MKRDKEDAEDRRKRKLEKKARKVQVRLHGPPRTERSRIARAIRRRVGPPARPTAPAARTDAADMQSFMGYTNESNPFGDSNLHAPFMWKKKVDRDVEEGKEAPKLTHAEFRKKRVRGRFARLARGVAG